MPIVAAPSFRPGIRPTPKKKDDKVKPTRKVGGGYLAVDNGDGTFDLKDVDVFAELPKGAKRNKKPIGIPWMEAAISRNQAREKEGYLPPVHVFHSDEVAVKPTYAGKLRLKDVREITYEGKPIAAVSADIIEIPAHVFSLIEKGQLPYRSVEVHDWNNAEIDSLALMPSDVPFFRLANLTVGRIVKLAADAFKEKSPAIWTRDIDKTGSLILFKFQEKQMEPEDKKDDKDADLKDHDDNDEKKKGEHPKIDFEDKEEEKEDEGANLMDPQAPPPWVAQMMQVLGTIAERVGAAQPETPAEPPQGAEDLSPVAGMRAKGASAKTKENKAMESKQIEELVSKATLKAITPLIAKVATLEDKGAAGEKKEVTRLRMESAEKDLEGTAMGDVVRGHLLKCAETQDDKDFAETVDCFKKSLPVDPPENLGGFEAMLARSDNGAVGEEAESEIQKFIAKHPGPKAAAWGKAQLKAFSDYRKLTPNDEDPMSAEEWLASNMKNERPVFA